MALDYNEHYGPEQGGVMQEGPMLTVSPCISFGQCVWLVGTESTLGGTGVHKGAEPAGTKVDTTAGSSSAQKIEKPQEVISFEAAKEVLPHGCLIALATETSSMCFRLEIGPSASV